MSKKEISGWLELEKENLKMYQDLLNNTLRNVSEDGPVMRLHSLTSWVDMRPRNTYWENHNPFPVEAMTKELLQEIPYRIREMEGDKLEFILRDISFELSPEKWTVFIKPLRPYLLEVNPPVQNQTVVEAYDVLRSYERKEISLIKGAIALRKCNAILKNESHHGIQKLWKTLHTAWFLKFSSKGKAEFTEMCERDERSFHMVKEEFEETKKSQIEDLINLIHHMNKSGLMALLREIERDTDYAVVFQDFCTGDSYMGTDELSGFCENILKMRDQAR